MLPENTCQISLHVLPYCAKYDILICSHVIVIVILEIKPSEDCCKWEYDEYLITGLPCGVSPIGFWFHKKSLQQSEEGFKTDSVEWIAKKKN